MPERHLINQIEVIQSPELGKINPQANFYNFGLDAGNKRLSLNVNFYSNKAIADTHIRNLGKQPILGATSALYVRAAEIISEVADRRRIPISYSFTSWNPAMLLWANDDIRGGRAIFGWKYSHNTHSVGGKIFRKTFGKEHTLLGRLKKLIKIPS